MIRYKCRGPRVSKDSVEREGCGAVLDELIDKVASDGEDHLIECPSCGNESSVRRVSVKDLEDGDE